MYAYGPHPFGKSVANNACKFRYCKIEEGVLPSRFELRSQAAAKKCFDLRAAEWSKVIGGRGSAVGGAEQPAVLLELISAFKRHEQFVGKAERQAFGRAGLFRQSRDKQIFNVGDNCARQRHDRAVSDDAALCRLDLKTFLAVIDREHSAIERQGQACPASGNRCSVTFNDAPVDAGIVEVVKVPRRNGFELGAADVCADCVDQRIPAAAWLKHRRHRHVRLFLCPLAHPRVKLLLRFKKFPLSTLGESVCKRSSSPRWRILIDRAVLFLRDCNPRVAVRGMQPPAAEIEGRARRSRHRPCAAAKSGAGLDYQTSDVHPRKAVSGGKAGRATAHDCHLDIIICHFRSVPGSSLPVHIAMVLANANWSPLVLCCGSRIIAMAQHHKRSFGRGFISCRIPSHSLKKRFWSASANGWKSTLT